MTPRSGFGFSSVPPRHLLILGAAVVVPPLLTLGVQELNYALSIPVCRGRLSPIVLHVMKLLAIALLTTIALYGRRWMGRGQAMDTDAEASLAAFAGFLVLAITGLCILIVISQWIAVFALSCTY